MSVQTLGALPPCRSKKGPLPRPLAGRCTFLRDFSMEALTIEVVYEQLFRRD
jgi:hypothetical protein